MVMTQRLTIHQPVMNAKSLEQAEKQRIFDTLMIQRNVQIIFDEIADKQHLDSFILKDVELTAGEANYIDHLLGRKIYSWMPGKKNANAVVWEDTTDTVANSSINIALWCSADVTLDIIVF